MQYLKNRTAVVELNLMLMQQPSMGLRGLCDHGPQSYLRSIYIYIH